MNIYGICIFMFITSDSSTKLTESGAEGGGGSKTITGGGFCFEEDSPSRSKGL
jgi:hypothetical protein